MTRPRVVSGVSPILAERYRAAVAGEGCGMTAYLMVRAEVPEADRAAFDRWYETDHLPDAKAAFRALSARRGWSAVTPGVHVAFYEFPDAAQASAAVASDEMKRLIADFDRAWPGRVKRSREIVEIAQAI